MVVPVLRIGKQSDIRNVATSFNKMPRGETSMNESSESTKKVALGGRGKSINVPGSILIDGSTEIAIGFKAVRYFAEAFCGKDSVVGNLIKPNLSFKPEYYTIDLADDNEILRYMNCVIDTFGFSTSPGNELTGSVGYISNKITETVYDVSSDTVLYDGSDSLTYLNTDATFGGVDLAGMGKSLNFQAQNNIDASKFNVLKGREYPLIRLGDLGATVTMEVLDFENILRNKYWGGASSTGVNESSLEDLEIILTDKVTGDKLKVVGKARITTLTTSTPVNDITTTSVTFTYESDENDDLFYFEYIEA